MANYTVPDNVVDVGDEDYGIVLGPGKKDTTKELVFVINGTTGAGSVQELAYREPADYDEQGAGGTWRKKS